MAIYEGAPWWNAKERSEEPHTRLLALVNQIKQRQATRYDTMRRYASVYEHGYTATTRLSVHSKYLDDTKLYFNAAQNAVDTVVSMVAVNRVVPMALTEGATYSQRRKAEDLTQCIEGQWDDCEIDSLKEQIVTDCCMFEGIGLVKAFASPDSDAIVFERVVPLDVFVDDAESRDRKQRCFYHRQFRDRYVLLAEYGEAGDDLYGSAGKRRTAIKKAPGAKSDDDMETSTDLVEVWEAWHLPSKAPKDDAKGSGDGRHTIAIDGCTLVDEEWTEPRFPFAVFCPKKSRVGWWGIPIMRQLASGQREYERITEKIQRAHKKLGGAHFLAQAGVVDPRHISNDIGTFINVKGDLNQVREWTPTPVNPQTYQYQASLPEMMLRFIGTSQFAAQQQIPAGMEGASGKALELVDDKESQYLILWHRELERWALDVVDLMKMVVKQILEVNPAFSAKYREQAGYRTIQWQDVIKLDHVLRVFAVSDLPQRPQAKFNHLSQMLNAGAITPEQFRRLYRLPDLEAENDVELADTEVIDRNLDFMVMRGKYLSPEPFDNLALIVKRGGKFYNACRVQEVPDDKLELIRQYIADAQALLAPPQDSGAAPIPGGPPGPPQPGMPLPGPIPAPGPMPMGPPPPMNGAPPMPPPPMAA